MSYESIEDYNKWKHISRYGTDGDVCGFVLAWRYLRQRVHNWGRKTRT